MSNTKNSTTVSERINENNNINDLNFESNNAIIDLSKEYFKTTNTNINEIQECSISELDKFSPIRDENGYFNIFIKIPQIKFLILSK